MANGKDGKGIKIKMATAYKKLKVCAFILMVFLSLGCFFYLSFPYFNFSPKTQTNISHSVTDSFSQDKTILQSVDVKLPSEACSQ